MMYYGYDYYKGGCMEALGSRERNKSSNYHLIYIHRLIVEI